MMKINELILNYFKQDLVDGVVTIIICAALGFSLGFIAGDRARNGGVNPCPCLEQIGKTHANG